MKKIFTVLMALFIVTTLFITKVSAAPTAMLTPTLDTPELGQLKVCKAAGAGVTVGQLFTINVNNTSYTVPAGPTDGGYCVLAGQFPLNLDVTVQEVIPAGYDVSNIEVKPDRAQTTDVESGIVIVEIGSGVTEVIFTNRASGLPTPTARPTNTPTATPSCDPNCTPTPTPTPKGRLQICKEADGAGVSGYFSFNFVNRSKTVPVGACSALITVDAGTLTISEVTQAGYEVTDVYTIPANRLISKDLDAGSATVTIVQGNASSQTIVVFRNRAENQTVTPTPTGTLPTPTFTPTGTITPPTPTPTGTLATSTFTPTGTITPPTPTPTGTLATATFTPTVTGTPPTFTPTVTGTPPTPTFTPTVTGTPTVCTPIVVTADFSGVAVGQSIEGMGVVAPGLNINGRGTAIKLLPNVQPLIYLSPNTGGRNGGLATAGGFSDLLTRNNAQAHLYTFTFAPGVLVSDFSLHMLDFGDLNSTLSTDHYVSMTAYDANGLEVAKQELSYITNGGISDVYGNLLVSGDAIASSPGQPGNWTWHVSGNGIVRVVLEFGVGYDPNIAFDNLSFTTCLQSCTPSVVTADFSGVAVGQSIEGMGVVAPGLNINGRGTAIKLLPNVQPLIYLSPNTGGRNGGLATAGGFSDLLTRNNAQAHLYTFTFAPGVLVSDFSLHMLDFGDLNSTLSTDHYVSMTAYDANGLEVAKQELSYITNGGISDVYGNLLVSGDAIASSPGQPGNWTWHVSGNGIVRVVLEFGVGYDPNIAFDNLSFTTCLQSCTPSVVTADFSGVAVGQSIEGMGVVAPGLNINGRGTAIKLLPNVQPLIYLSPNTGGRNGGLATAGGFSDLLTRNNAQAHLYTFTFAPGVLVSDFSLHMLDFGDLNSTLSTDHYVSMTAYDANGLEVAKQELSYITNGGISDVYGNLLVSGDAIASSPGQPGNWTWHVSGNGIVRVVLEFGVGYDPNIAFDNLSFTTCPQP